MTADDFRRIALSMQGAIESAHMGHPDFRAGGRIFATLQADNRRGMVALTPEEQREFMRMYPRMFEPASGAWGRQGATMVRLDASDEPTVRGAIMLAWQRVMERARSRRTPKTGKVNVPRPVGRRDRSTAATRKRRRS